MYVCVHTLTYIQLENNLSTCTSALEIVEASMSEAQTHATRTLCERDAATREKKEVEQTLERERAEFQQTLERERAEFQQTLERERAEFQQTLEAKDQELVKAKGRRGANRQVGNPCVCVCVCCVIAVFCCKQAVVYIFVRIYIYIYI